MTIKEPLSIIGYGASTINGTSAEMTYAMQQADQKFFKKHDEVYDFENNQVTIGNARYINEEEEFPERFLILGKNALIGAIKTLDSKKIHYIKLLVGLPEIRDGLSKDLEEILTQSFEEILKEFPDFQINFFYGDHSICSQIIESCPDILKDNTICIVGGIDSYQHFDTLLKMQLDSKLLTVENKYGIIASEGAGFVTLTSKENADRLNIRTYADIINTDTEEEKEEFSKGKALTKVLKEALKRLPKDIKCSRILFDMNKRENSLEFGCSYVRMPKMFSDEKTLYRLPGSIGDVGTATIPLLIINALEEALWGDVNERYPLIISLSSKVKSALLIELNRFNEIEYYKIA